MCEIDKERNKIVTCLCCKHCLPPSKRINGELCSLKIKKIRHKQFKDMNNKKK